MHERTYSGSCIKRLLQQSTASRPSCPGKRRCGREALFVFSPRLMEHLVSVGYLQVVSGILSPTLLLVMSSDAQSTIAARGSSVYSLQCRFFSYVDWAEETIHLNRSLWRLQGGNAHCVSRPWVCSYVSFSAITGSNKHLQAIGMAVGM